MAENETYIGAHNLAGQRHGRGTLSTLLDNSVVSFAGHFINGEKEGRGTFIFEDGLGDEDINLLAASRTDFTEKSFLSGVWHADIQQGPGEYVYADGARMIGTWIDGQLEGRVYEFDCENQLTFDGMYADNQRNGLGRLRTDGGGVLEGEWHNGVLQGHAVFMFSDGSNFKGEWRDGNMHSAIFSTYSTFSKAILSSTKISKRARTASGKSAAFETVVYTMDESTDVCMCAHPLQIDPYEYERVYVANSRILGAEEGLFAKRDLADGEIASFYNGLKIDLTAVERRPWSLNSNVISTSATTCIDVPRPYDTLSNYCATMGHKANHAFSERNACYDSCFHPRFGAIKCIRTLRAVTAGEELTVDYGYAERSGPKWYMKARLEFRAQEAALQP